MRNLPFLLALLLMSPQLFAQRDMDEIRFNVNGQTLERPFEGGFNSTMLFGEDLTNNGKRDLIVYEKSSQNFIGYRNEGEPGETNYVYDESLTKHFPKPRDWAFVVDFNQDGVADLFTRPQLGGGAFSYYQGSWENDRLVFENRIDRLETMEGYQLYTTTSKLPAFSDINGDGDMDILVFELFDRVIEYYENQEVELGISKDTVVIKRKSNCWGYACECSDSTNNLTLNYNSGNCFHKLWDPFPGNGGNTTRHAGSTLLAFDEDKDGDKDLLLGDAGYSSLVFLENDPGGHDSLVAYDERFPIYDVSVKFNIFPAPSYVDVNNDNKKDLLISTYSRPLCHINVILDTPYNANLMYYQNMGSERDSFVYQTSNFLIGEMVDIGFTSHPTFFDYNSDGLLDIVAGRCYQRSASDPDSIMPGLALFENTGTASSPAYELVSQDYANLSQYGYLGTNPHFADMDNDGDQDLILGLRSGSLIYFENVSAASQPAQFQRRPDYFNTVDPVTNAAPFVADVNEDGLPDLLVGDRQGKIAYYENTGTAGQATFSLVREQWGGVDVRRGNLYGNAVPWLGDANNDGSRELLVGNENGEVLRYSNIDGNIGGNFSLVDSNYLEMHWGSMVHISSADIDGNGAPDFLLGNHRGGIRLRTFGKVVGLPPAKAAAGVQFHVFPNPANDQLTVRMGKEVAGDITIYDLTGTARFTQQHVSGNTSILDVSHLSNGVYLVEFKTSASTQMQKVVIKR